MPPRGCDKCHRAHRGVCGGWRCSPAPRGRHWPGSGGAAVTPRWPRTRWHCPCRRSPPVWRGHRCPAGGAVSRPCSHAFCPISSRHRGAAEPEPGADRRHKDQGGQATATVAVKCHPRAPPPPHNPGERGGDPRDQTSLLWATASLRDTRSQVSPSSLGTSQVTASRVIGSGGMGGGDMGHWHRAGGTGTGAEAAW